MLAKRVNTSWWKTKKSWIKFDKKNRDCLSSGEWGKCAKHLGTPRMEPDLVVSCFWISFPRQRQQPIEDLMLQALSPWVRTTTFGRIGALLLLMTVAYLKIRKNAWTMFLTPEMMRPGTALMLIYKVADKGPMSMTPTISWRWTHTANLCKKRQEKQRLAMLAGA